jgi:hypothetical protein
MPNILKTASDKLSQYLMSAVCVIGLQAEL